METYRAQNNAITTLDTEPCTIEFPTFAGLAHEHFVIFKNKYTTAAQARGISRIDQVEKLRDRLTGKASAYLPKEGIGDIDAAWEYLGQVYGDSYSILNFYLAPQTPGIVTTSLACRGEGRVAQDDPEP